MRPILVPLLLCACTPEPPATPDVLLVVIDTLRADHTSTLGYSRPTTPNLDQLAADGWQYERAFAQSGWTLPSTTSLLTGLRPHQHKVVRDAARADTFGRLAADAPTLAGYHKAAGYRTGAFVNNTFLAPEFGLQQGFETYDYAGALNDQHRSATETVKLALDWMDAATGPTFTLVHFMEPHLDYVPPEAFSGRFAVGPRPARLTAAAGQDNPFTTLQTGRWKPEGDEIPYLVALYDEELLAADAALGELIAGLRARGRLEQTLIVVTADHGEEFWEQGGFEHGHALWSPITRVPLVLRGPGFRGGESVDTVVEHIDLVHSLYRRLGPVPEGVGGEALDTLAADTRRVALQESCIYGPPCWSILDGNHRLTVRSAPGGTLTRELHPLDPAGLERAGPPPAEIDALARPLFGYALAIRGTPEPGIAVDGTRLPDFEAFEMLKSLGYVDREATPAPHPHGPPDGSPSPHSSPSSPSSPSQSPSSPGSPPSSETPPTGVGKPPP